MANLWYQGFVEYIDYGSINMFDGTDAEYKRLMAEQQEQKRLEKEANAERLRLEEMNRKERWARELIEATERVAREKREQEEKERVEKEALKLAAEERRARDQEERDRRDRQIAEREARAEAKREQERAEIKAKEEKEAAEKKAEKEAREAAEKIEQEKKAAERARLRKEKEAREAEERARLEAEEKVRQEKIAAEKAAERERKEAKKKVRLEKKRAKWEADAPLRAEAERREQEKKRNQEALAETNKKLEEIKENNLYVESIKEQIKARKERHIQYENKKIYYDNIAGILRDLQTFGDVVTSVAFTAAGIDNTGAYYISDFLKGDKRLKFLNLENNKIGLQGMIDLFSALEHNETLASINLNGNGGEINENESKKNLIPLLQKCRTLVCINLRDVKFGPKGKTALVELIRENKNILVFENASLAADEPEVQKILGERFKLVQELAKAWKHNQRESLEFAKNEEMAFPLYAAAISYVLETKLNEPELAASFERYIADIVRKPKLVAPSPTPTPPSAPATLPTSGSPDSKGGKKEPASPGGTEGKSKPASSNKNSLLAALTGGTVSAGLFMVYARNASAALPKNYVVIAAGVSLGVAAVAGICYYLRNATSKDPEDSKSPGK